jgi:hypothetical protein
VPKDNDTIVLNGFKDADNHIVCCFSCKEIHYSEKNKSEHANKYSEIPLTLQDNNLLIE